MMPKRLPSLRELREVAGAWRGHGEGMQRQQGGPPAKRCEDCEVRTQLQLQPGLVTHTRTLAQTHTHTSP